jgi:hypothetical protein
MLYLENTQFDGGRIEMKFCPHCGTKLLAEDAPFCHECGRSTREAPKAPPPQATPVRAKPQGIPREKLAMGIVLVMLVILALAGGVSFFGSGSSSSTYVTTTNTTATATQTRTSITTTTEITSTTMQERLVAVLSGPIEGQYQGSTPVDNSKSLIFRPIGQSLKVVVTVTPTLETKAYGMTLTYYVHVISHDGVALGYVSDHVDPWDFQKGSYVSEKIITLKTTNVDCYVTVSVDVNAHGLTKYQQFATIDVSIYDLT